MAGAKDSNSGDRIPNQSENSAVDEEKKRGNEDSSSSSSSPSSCSICLELVVDDGIRSRAKLQCGHQFHLDCIGSAFNMKGTMQCPNCRNVEKGQWLFANGSTRSSSSSFQEFVMEDWMMMIPEEDLYGLSYPEMQYRVHWCPFGELSGAGSFEEVEPTTTTYHNEFHGHQHHHAAAMNHSYLAYIAPNPRTQDNNNNNNNADDHLPWNHQLAIPPQYHHHHSEIESSSIARGISYPQHPFLFSYRSNPRASPAMQYHHRQQQHGPNIVSVTRRGLPPPPPPPPPMQDQNNGGFFIYPPQPPPSSSETDQFHHSWERDWFPHFPVPSNHHHHRTVWNRHF